MEISTESPPAGPVGRVVRLALALCLGIIALPVYLEAGARYNVSALGLAVTLVALYTLVHAAISRWPVLINRWLGAAVVVIPLFLVWLLGQGGGPLFGQGEGGTAAITFLAVSFLVDSVRAHSGCEVMAVPGLLLARRTHLPCLLLGPIDRAEAAGGEGPR